MTDPRKRNELLSWSSEECAAMAERLQLAEAERDRLREDFCLLYDAVDKAQRRATTPEAIRLVSVALWSWAERRDELKEKP